MSNTRKHIWFAIPSPEDRPRGEYGDGPSWGSGAGMSSMLQALGDYKGGGHSQPVTPKGNK